MSATLQVTGTVAHSLTNTGELKWGEWSQQGYDPTPPKDQGLIFHPSGDGRVLKRGVRCELGSMYWFDVHMPE